MNFASDNASGATQHVLDALIAANDGSAPAYGTDPWTQKAETMLADLFEREVGVFLVATGTAANALALAALCPPWGAVFCHEDSHVIEDECGAPEMFTAGAKLVGLPGDAGKITPDGLAPMLERFPRGVVKTTQPSALSLSQATECGTLYTVEEIAALAAAAHAAGMGVHMDGARFANAIVSTGVTPAQMTWKAGVDVLTFGFTKNGAWACEAVVFFDKEKAEAFAYRRKRSGHTLSKGRLLGAQAVAMLEDDRWLTSARHANACAQRLAQGLAAIPGARLAWPRQANEVFPILPASSEATLREAGVRYYDWSARCLPQPFRPGEDARLLRMVTSFATPMEHVEKVIALAQGAASRQP